MTLPTPMATLLAAFALATPAAAGVDEALETDILPGFAGFAAAAARLAQAAGDDCTADAVKPAFNAAFDAWMAVADLRLGPSESAAPAIAFWPDDRGFTARALKRMVADQDPVANDPVGYAEVSVAARGFFALEMLLYDPEFADDAPGSYRCTLVRTVATDLSNEAAGLDSAWSGAFAATLLSAGQPGNATYLTRDEAVRAIYTQILSGLEFTGDSRIGRPIGTFDRPRPRLAEAWRSGRSVRNAMLSVEAALRLAHSLAGWGLPETDAAAEKARGIAARIADPGFQDVTDPQARLRAEALQGAVREIRAAVETEIGARLGIAPGFNAQDGD